MEADRKALRDLGYKIYEVDLQNKTAKKLKSEPESSEMIFVAGGNTTYLFEQVHITGFDTIIRDLLSGHIYIGSSAGSILAVPTVASFVEEDAAELPKDFILHAPQGLNLVNYIVLLHYPSFAKENDKILKHFSDQYNFVKLTDEEWRVK